MHISCTLIAYIFDSNVGPNMTFLIWGTEFVWYFNGDDDGHHGAYSHDQNRACVECDYSQAHHD